MRTLTENNKNSHRSKGFTLIELLVGMAVTSIISILAIQIITAISKSFNEDQKTGMNSQKMTSVLEVIGREIRQAGESIVEPNFPTVQVRKRGNRGASIIVYRALSEPITMCSGYAAGTKNIQELTLATDKNAPLAVNVSRSYCTVEAAEAGTEIFPPSRKEGWIDKRLSSPLLIGGKNALFGAVYSISNKSIQSFIYTNETKTISTIGGSLTLKVNTAPFTAVSEIKLDDIAYLLEKKEYLVCTNNELKVRTNSLVESSLAAGANPTAADPACADAIPASDPTGSVDTVATNIDKLEITMTTRPTSTDAAPNPVSTKQSKNNSFPITLSPDITWQNIEGINVNILAIDPLGKQGSNPSGRNASSLSAKDIAAFSAEGTFYPRNALSSK
jgi:prepilin-type N-terminal cleavage/methylation domain-containing protein